MLTTLLATLLLAQPAPDTPPAHNATADMGQRLVAALEGVEGCLDADSARTTDGRVVIFAWFEDREAALRWYHHPMHVMMRHGSGLEGRAGDAEDRVPMADLPEGVPVLAVACLRFDGPPAVPESPIPFSAISIEMFTPIPGGLRLNGGFSPEGFIPAAPTTRPADDSSPQQQSD